MQINLFEFNNYKFDLNDINSLKKSLVTYMLIFPYLKLRILPGIEPVHAAESLARRATAQ